MHTRPSLNVDVHVAPMRPFVGPPPQGPGDDPVWSPYITHGHSDHWIGLGRILDAFPEARGVATPDVVARARFETSTPAIAAYWNTSFAGELPDQRVLPEALTGSVLELEGQALHAISVGQSDTEHSTILHVPSARAVIAGDVVYNGVHMMTAETDPAGRAAWIANLDAIAALEPSIVVSGHKRVGTTDDPSQIAASQGYLRDFDQALGENETVEEVVAAMLRKHGDRDNARVLWHGARTAVARRDAA